MGAVGTGRRPGGIRDVAAIRGVNLQAFGKTYEPDLVEALRADPTTRSATW